MNDDEPQFTLREWRLHMAHPATLTALAGVALVLAMAGPFGTDMRLSFGARLVYWLTTAVLCYGVGALSDVALRPVLNGRDIWLRIGITALFSGICIAGVVTLINLLAFGLLPDLKELPGALGPVIAIAAVITAVLAVVRLQLPDAPARPTPEPARILRRIAVEKRGALVALSVEDHYVRIQTTKGEDLVLMRLSDAITETGETPGAQVHRSHWAAFDQVHSARRAGDRAILTMSNGAEIPVSRANVASIKEAGLLP